LLLLEDPVSTPIWLYQIGATGFHPYLNGVWVPHETRDAGVDYVRHWTDRAETPAKQILAWMGVPEGTYL